MSTEAKKSTTKSTKSTTAPSNKAPKSKPSKSVDAEIISSKTSTSANSDNNLNIDNKTLILLAHILGLVTSFVAPLIVYLITEDKLVKQHSASALNFQISLLIYGTILTVVGGFLTVITLGLFGILMVPLYLLLGAYALIPPILATIKAHDNIKEVYTYPLSITIISK